MRPAVRGTIEMVLHALGAVALVFGYCGFWVGLAWLMGIAK